MTKFDVDALVTATDGNGRTHNAQVIEVQPNGFRKVRAYAGPGLQAVEFAAHTAELSPRRSKTARDYR